MAAYVLMHSLLLGPLTWAPVAARLRATGAATVVPSFLDVTVGDPPFWPRVVETVDEAVAQLPPDRPVLLVAHSNAGVFVPVVAAGCRRAVAGCLFVDARLPARVGPTPAASPERLDTLRAMATGGRLPPWTAWWDEDEVAALFPDAHSRAAISAEQPRLPLSYYEQEVPAPDGWDDRPCGYLAFGPPYDRMAEDARERGWDVDQIAGGHLHQVVDPDAVAARIAAMTGRWHPPAG
ncbi:MAG TPA: alpha/beta hydrolase [Rugosimonospora sp.]|nr:alpha/beta hydrolase [Rugosimonospora sp.]